MRILLIRNYPSFMDVINNTYNIQEVGLAKALVRQGNTCDILFWTDQEEKEVEISVEDFGIVRVFYRKGKTAVKNTVFTGCDKIFERYDILQTSEYNQIQSWILAKSYKNKMIIFHGPYFSKFNKKYNLMCYFFDIFFLNRYKKLNTCFITKSEMASKFLLKKHILNENIDTIGVGIDAQMLTTSDDKDLIPLHFKMKNEKGIKLLYIGRFEERRNLLFLLEILKVVLASNDIEAKLFLVGVGEKKYTDKFWELVREYKLENNIVYEEKIEQKFLSQVYSQADFFLLPTEYEIFGMVLLEAMYYGNVVITTRNGGSSTLIEDGINGYIKDVEDPAEWASVITKVFSDSDTMKKIGIKAKYTVENNYTWDNLAMQFESAYKKVLEKKNNELNKEKNSSELG